MRLTALRITNYLGIDNVEIDLRAPILLVAGANGSGKSSLVEAVRHALGGEGVRVGLKKDSEELLRDGTKAGYVDVFEWHPVGGMDGSAYCVNLPSGKRSAPEPATHPALAYVLDPPRFARETPNERRTFLFRLMGVQTVAEAVHARLLARGCDPEGIKAVLPLLRAGFEAAQKEAEALRRDCGTEWGAITGEKYGPKKAAGWKASAPANFIPAAIEPTRRALEAKRAEIERMAGEIGAAKARLTEAQARQRRLTELRSTASLYARREEALRHARADLAEYEAKLAEQEARIAAARTACQAGGNAPVPCPSCGTCLVIDGGRLALWSAPQEVEPEAEAELFDAPPTRTADGLGMQRRRVANCERDLAEAEAAAKLLRQLEDAAQPEPVLPEVTETDLQVLREEARRLEDELRKLEAAARQAAEAAEKTRRAQAAHERYLAWDAIVAALAPDGIPGELLREALGPINERLADSSFITGWPVVVVGPEMDILYGRRAYALCSESERWRADAMIAAAIAELSGLKLLLLDRADVLDQAGRSDLIAWLDDLAVAGRIETAIVAATLKQLPPKLPVTVTAVWMEGGSIGDGEKRGAAQDAAREEAAQASTKSKPADISVQLTERTTHNVDDMQ